MSLPQAFATASGHVPRLVQVTVSTALFRFDGHALSVLLSSTEDTASGMDFPKAPFVHGSALLEQSVQILKDLGIQHFAEVHHVGAFEAHKWGGGLGDLNLVTLAVCRKDTSENAAAYASHLHWLNIAQLESLPERVTLRVQEALKSLRHKARFDTTAFELLGEEFSLSELQRVFEAILGRSIDVRNFRKKIEALNILSESPNKPRGMAYRPPRLFCFEHAQFANRLETDGEVRFF
jgi:hypothetical protein